MGFVFFPSFSFMGVMLFPSFALGNVSGGGSTLLVPLSLFFILLSLPLFSSPSPSFPIFFHISISLFPFLPHKLFHPFSSSPLFHLFPFLFLLLLFHFLLLPFCLLVLLFPFLLLPFFFLKFFFFFFRELLVPSISEM